MDLKPSLQFSRPLKNDEIICCAWCGHSRHAQEFLCVVRMTDINYSSVIISSRWRCMSHFEWQRHSICSWHPSLLHFPAQFIFLSLSVPLPLTQVENDQKASKGGGRVRSMLAPWWRLAWKEQLWRAWWSSIQCCIWATKGLVERVGGES